MHIKKSNLKHYLKLIRFYNPIGFFLVLWPGMWSLWLAAKGSPSLKNIAIFVAGSFVMRCAGCIINDIMDRNFDNKIQRTKKRPLTSGLISLKESMELFIIFIFLALILVLFTNKLTIQLSFFAAGIAIIYPLMKRFTYFPQAVLGLAFSYPVLMAFTAEVSCIPSGAWWLYAGCFFWIMAYDTYYAMVDKSDDLTIGIKSTAILFKHQSRIFIAFFNTATILCFFVAGLVFRLNFFFFAGLIVTIFLFGYQLYLTKNNETTKCFSAFLHNNWVGLVIFTSILASLVK